jgi:hypothetical protein
MPGLNISPYFHTVILFGPVMVAERCKALTIFARSDAVIVGTNPTYGMDIWYVYVFFYVCAVVSLGRDLATS